MRVSRELLPLTKRKRDKDQRWQEEFLQNHFNLYIRTFKGGHRYDLKEPSLIFHLEFLYIFFFNWDSFLQASQMQCASLPTLQPTKHSSPTQPNLSSFKL
jgi:hypothetical protein